MRVEGQKVSKTDGFLRFWNFRSNPLRESGCRVSKTEGFLRFFLVGCKTRAECQKVRVFCDFGVPEFVLRSVLTTCFATYGPFFKKPKMLRFFHVPSNPLQQSGLRVSIEGFWPFLDHRICPNDLFCHIRALQGCPEVVSEGSETRPAGRLDAPKWPNTGLNTARDAPKSTPNWKPFVLGLKTSAPKCPNINSQHFSFAFGIFVAQHGPNIGLKPIWNQENSSISAAQSEPDAGGSNQATIFFIPVLTCQHPNCTLWNHGLKPKTSGFFPATALWPVWPGQ